MRTEEALSILAAHRTARQLVITNQMSARLWPRISHHRLDFTYLSSTMGGAVPLGIGLALARPEYEIVVVSGDGSLLMSLGSLVTATANHVTNLTIVLLDNGLYEVTGGQATPGACAEVDYAGLARAAGFATAESFADESAWQSFVRDMHDRPGPRFARLAVAPVDPSTPRDSSTRVADELRRVKSELMSEVEP